MIFKIYFAAHPVFLCSQLDEMADEHPAYTDSIFLTDLSERSLSICMQLLEKPGNYACYYLYHDLQKLMDALLGTAITIDAGGGIVYNERDEILLIFRRGKWDLPKGKVEKKEKIPLAAIRECEEECGVKDLGIIKKLLPTFHLYKLNGKFVLKITHWFLMTAPVKQKLKAQKDEGITKVKWFKNMEIHQPLKNTYPSIREIFSHIHSA